METLIIVTYCLATCAFAAIEIYKQPGRKITRQRATARLDAARNLAHGGVTSTVATKRPHHAGRTRQGPPDGGGQVRWGPKTVGLGHLITAAQILRVLFWWRRSPRNPELEKRGRGNKSEKDLVPKSFSSGPDRHPVRSRLTERSGISWPPRGPAPAAAHSASRIARGASRSRRA
jgi:hypothetical protein